MRIWTQQCYTHGRFADARGVRLLGDTRAQRLAADVGETETGRRDQRDRAGLAKAFAIVRLE